MGLFSASGKQQPVSTDSLVHSLIEIATFGGGNETAHEKANMDKVLSRVESKANEASDELLLYWLGIARRNYTAWHIRGDDRKPYLEKTTDYFRKALDKSKAEGLPLRLPLENRHDAAHIDQVTIASELGDLLVNEAMIRDLDEAEKVLSFVASNTNGYEPCLCAYAELYYKRGDYKQAARVALDAYQRAVKSAKTEWEYNQKLMKDSGTVKWDVSMQEYVGEVEGGWRNLVAPAPLNIAGMSFRALGRQAKKDGDLPTAKAWFGKIIKLGVATDNDKKILEKL